MKRFLIELGDDGYNWITNNWTFILGIVAGLFLTWLVIINL